MIHGGKLALSAAGLITFILFYVMYNEYVLITFSKRGDAPGAGSPWRNGTRVDPCDVVVMVLTGSVFHETRLKDISNTYRKQACQTDPRYNVLFISDAANDSIPTLGAPCGNGYDHSMCCKVINGWKLAHKLYPHAKFYIQADDDSYFVMRNLLPYLSKFNPDEPLYTGHPLYITLSEADGGMVNTGREERWSNEDLVYAPGYFGVISRAGMNRIFEYKADQAYLPLCAAYFWPDVVVGIVLRTVGIFFH